MIQPIVKDPVMLAQPSQPATAEDAPVAQDLRDTLHAHAEHCVGMAANMIGVHRRIIAVNDRGSLVVMFNPEILRASGSEEGEEGCLSLPGVRMVRRWRTIKVRYLDEDFRVRIKKYEGWTARIIQHEIDHCNGVLV